MVGIGQQWFALVVCAFWHIEVYIEQMCAQFAPHSPQLLDAVSTRTCGPVGLFPIQCLSSSRNETEIMVKALLSVPL